MKRFIAIVLLTVSMQFLHAQQPLTLAQIKTNMENSPNPLGYVRDVLKKRYKLDTIIISNTTRFGGIADSLAYYGKIKKVYGPIQKRYLVQVLSKLPNTFNRVSQIFIDTTIFTRRIADSLANSIIARIKSGASTFEDMAMAYSMGGEGASKGDLGWIARGAMLPDIEKALTYHKTGEVFRLWSNNGLHIIKKSAEPKQDTGFVLMLQVWL